MNFGWIWIMGGYYMCVNTNHGWMWIMGEYELWARMNFGWNKIMGAYYLCVVGCSVMLATNEDLADETGWVK